MAIRYELRLVVSFALLATACPGKEPADDDATAQDDDDTAPDDDTTEADDDTTGDDDTGDDDGTGDDDTTSPAACDGTGADLVVPLDQPTIQSALSAASTGDRICVEPGTYVEQLDFLGKAVELFGARGAEETTISGGGGGPVVTFGAGEGPDSILRGFTIADGVADSAGGGLFVQDSSPTVEDLLIRDCHAGLLGGGIAVVHGDLVLRNSRIESCESVHSGGGIGVLDSLLTLSGIWFVANTAYYSGGALQVDDSVVKGDNLLLWGSFAGYEGGGVEAGDSDLEFTHVVFAGNTADNSGGGLSATGTEVSGSNLVFAGNTAEYVGGGLEVGDLYAVSTLDVQNVTFVANFADNSGGAIRAQGEGLKRLDNTIAAQNSAGGCCCGGIAGSPFHMRFSDRWENVPEMEICIGWSPEPDNQEGNISTDPLFTDMAGADPSTWDLHLQTGSPLVDAGDPSLADPDGSISDMGAFGGPAADGWDLDSDGYPSWWQPGPYDSATYPAQGWDCDDMDPAVHPGSGC